MVFTITTLRFSRTMLLIDDPNKRYMCPVTLFLSMAIADESSKALAPAATYSRSAIMNGLGGYSFLTSRNYHTCQYFDELETSPE
ncbi:hypothetical protein PTT_19234 [Pyrenophora teres f. teres 0-1]|uniref:Uncharacterized protein n=1 Tax=Pyrenophora teres f. teres (strain 0-1) TaxID=861557 RepID=E3S8G4_PYRTT|nr:hypothetical protein PTT_19234 [Pyrenophora teres f. teres 0-1]